MADFSNTAVELISQKKPQLDPSLAPDLPDLASLSLSDLEILSGLNLVITDAALNAVNQPRCTGRLERIVDEIEGRAWHYVNAIAEEAASRQPDGQQERLIRAKIILGSQLDTEGLEDAILRLADEIKAAKSRVA